MGISLTRIYQFYFVEQGTWKDICIKSNSPKTKPYSLSLFFFYPRTACIMKYGDVRKSCQEGAQGGNIGSFNKNLCKQELGSSKIGLKN